MRRLSQIFGSLLLVMTFATGASKAQDLDNTLYLELEDGRVVIQLRPISRPSTSPRIKRAGGARASMTASFSTG